MEIIYDGKSYAFERGTNALDIAGKISGDLKKTALAARVDGVLTALAAPIESDATLEFVTFDDEEGRKVFRHTASHILAQAVLNLRPEAKLAIGPAIEDGFYYDFDVDEPFTPDFLKQVEKEMGKIVKQNLRLERFELPRAEAIAFEKERDQPYKVELIEDLPEDSVISFYKQGDFTDLCAGPHLPATGKVKAFKLLSVAGAYWRGDEKNKMLQRIYGTAYPDKEMLDTRLKQLEEAKKRDHRKLGRELDLFMLTEEGPGFPFFLPKGMVLYNTLIDYWHGIHRLNGYDEIKTPIMLGIGLWHNSGHWDHYKETMYTSQIDGDLYAIKPMNCPGGILAYKRKNWSYRELPNRTAELGLVHRHELSGTLHGLMRVRCFTQDDAHIFLTPDRINDEVIGVYRMITDVYKQFGFSYHVELSTRPENSMGTQEQWDMATNALRNALIEVGEAYVVNEGDGAFYGPKIDFHLTDSLGRTWQCGTIQLDFQMPERFDLTYIGPDGERHRPVMIHRVVYGAIERFIGILIEHFAGAFPLWLAPVQAKILTITDRADEAARALLSKLESAGIRAEMDLRNEKIGFKIREAQMQKVPYMLVLGDKEAEANQAAVRSHKMGDLGVMGVEELVEKLARENAERVL